MPNRLDPATRKYDPPSPAENHWLLVAAVVFAVLFWALWGASLVQLWQRL